MLKEIRPRESLVQFSEIGKDLAEVLEPFPNNLFVQNHNSSMAPLPGDNNFVHS